MREQIEIVIINCPEYTEALGGKKYRHIASAAEPDRTLCGNAFEGQGRNYEDSPTIKNGTINCPDCIKIIKYCKSIKTKYIKEK